VTDGRVAVQGIRNGRAQGSVSVLSARMLGVVDDSGYVRMTPRIDVDDYTAWTTGRLVFRDTPVRDVMTELGRAYDVEFRMSDSALARLPLTWTVRVSSATLPSALEELGDMLDVHFAKVGRVITVVSGRPSVRHTRSSSKSLFTPESHYGR